MNNLAWMARAVALAGLALQAPIASAIEMNLNFADQDFNAILNQTITAGVGFRIEERDSRLVGKSNIDPGACAGVYQSCQGLHRTQVYPSQHLRSIPGAASLNFDDGNLNFDRGDVTQSPMVWTHDLKIESGDFGFFYRGRAVYDPALYHLDTNYPNRITAQNAASVGTTGNGPANRYFTRTYGPGGDFSGGLSEAEAQQIGLRYPFLDANFFGSVAIPGDRELQIRLGRQTVQWGESTVAILNSVNQAQPISANNFFRYGNGLLEDLYVPVNMLRMSTNIVDSLSIEGYYQFEFRSVEVPVPGTLNSFVDLGTPNQRDFINASFGGSADDPDCVARGRQDNPLTLITPTCLRIGRYQDRRASDQGQFGFKLGYYAEELNNGTEFSLYFMNYHSQLPYFSTYATNASCARREGSAIGIDARNTAEFLQSCPNLPLTALSASTQLGLDTIALLTQSPGTAIDLGLLDLNSLPGFANLLLPRPGLQQSDAVPFETARFQFEYPENRKLIGFSFNTTYGDYSYQGEIAYRPNVPLQVATVDLVFAAFGPTLTRCHDVNIGCAGATNTLGFTEDGGNTYQLYDSSNFVDANGNNPYPDAINLVVGAAPGSARSFPNFITPYRGGIIGENAPNSYIRGWIPGKVFQYTFGATRVLSGTENWIGADQVIMLYEVAATHVLNLPKFDQLQIEGPGAAYTHASAGADGSGADGSRLACSTNPSCTVGPDGLRFNPFQASRNQFAHSFAGGYRIVSRVSYESVLPGISIQPLLIFQHDVYNNSPGPGANFVEGRIQLNSVFEIRYEKSASFSITYNAYTRGGANNLIRDRDNIGFFFKYQF